MNVDQDFEAKVQEITKGAVKKAVQQAVNSLTANVQELMAAVEAIHKELTAERTTREALELKVSELLENAVESAAKVDVLEEKVGAKNRSAAVKKNMTDEDARSVMIGEHAELPHKEAGEVVGLTYAQVYSCRLEYTFKHIHKELRDNGWTNPWVK